jgi:peroxiredoxin
MNAGGALYKSSEHPGVMVIESYFLSCPYCNDNAPNVHELASEYSMSTLVHVIDLGIDRSDSQYATWISRHSPEHPVLKDASRAVTNQLGTSGYPSAYVVDCNLNVTYKTTGVWGSEEKSEIRAAVNQALDTCVVPAN